MTHRMSFDGYDGVAYMRHNLRRFTFIVKHELRINLSKNQSVPVVRKAQTKARLCDWHIVESIVKTVVGKAYIQNHNPWT
jgi:hypothetical protein